MKTRPLFLKFAFLGTLSVSWADIDYLEANRPIDEPPIQDSTNIEFTFKDTPSSVTDVIPEIDHQFWPKSTSYLYLRDKQVGEAIKDFCKMQEASRSFQISFVC